MTATATTTVLGTDPYPWPYDGRLDGARLALVLAGWDRTWADRVAVAVPTSGDGGAVGLDDVVAACTDLASAVAAACGLVVAVAHGGAPALAAPTPATVVLTADGVDGCYGGPLDATLRRRGRTHLLVAGLGLEGPVHSTLRSANDRGYECLLVADACASLAPDLAAAAARTVTMSGGIFGAVGTLDATVQALAALAPPPPFREEP